MTEEELKMWQEHSMFNAYRYGIRNYEDVPHGIPTEEEVKEFQEWAEAWERMGVPG